MVGLNKLKLVSVIALSLVLSGCYTNFKTKNTDGTPPAGVLYKLALLGAGIVNVGDCTLYSVQTQDSMSDPLASDVATTVQLSDSGAGQFYSDASCTTAIGGVVIAANTFASSFYYKNNTVQNVAITGQDSTYSLLPANQAVVVEGPVNLSLTGPTTIGVNQCRLYTVHSQSATGANRAVRSDTTINLAGGGSGSFYSDAGCTTATSSVTISNGTSSSMFYFMDATPESVSINASDAGFGLNPASLNLLVDGPTQLDLFGPSALYADSCGQYSIFTVNAFSALSPVSVNTTVNLGGAGAGSFYADSNCTSAITSKVLSAGASSSLVYYKNATASTNNLTVTDGTTAMASDSQSVVISSASKIAISGPTALSTGVCYAYTAESQDSASAPATVLEDTDINLSGQGLGSFYANSNCSVPSTKATILNGTSSTMFYYRANSAQSVTLIGNSTRFGNAQLPVSVSGAKRLAIVGSNSISQNTCTAYTVQSRDNTDAASNVNADTTVNLSNAGSGSFYSDSGCTTGISSVVIANGTNASMYYFKSPSAGSNVMGANDLSAVLSPATFIVDVQASLAVLTISEDPLYDFGDVASGSTATHTLSVTNTGTETATNMMEAPGIALVTPFDFAGGSYPGTGGTCSNSLTVSSVCTLVVEFAPTTNGLFNDAVAIEYFNGSGSEVSSRNLMGTSTTTTVGGILDPDFSGDGVATYNLSGPKELLHAASIQQADGKIVVAGTAQDLTGEWDFALLRFNTNGSLDTSFGTNGLTLTDFRGGDDNAYAMTLQSDGKIIAVGRSTNSAGQDQGLALARYNTNGTLDTSFGGGDGIIVLRVGTIYQDVDEANAVAVDSSGRIIVAGRADNAMVFARFNSNGSALDTTFGGTGILVFSVTSGAHSALAMALQSDGKIVVTGYASDLGFNSSGVLTVRLTTSGSLDTSFNSTGYVTTPVGSSVDMGRAIALDSSGRIVIAGATSNSLGAYSTLLLRYTSAGALDTSFDADGMKITSFGSDPSLAEGIGIQADGKIVIAGYQWGSQDVFIVARFSSDGFLDTSFSGDGAAMFNGGRAHGMTIQSDGKIIAVGEATNRITVIRLIP